MKRHPPFIDLLSTILIAFSSVAFTALIWKFISNHFSLGFTVFEIFVLSILIEIFIIIINITRFKQ